MRVSTERVAELKRFAWQAVLLSLAACVIVFVASKQTAFMDLDSWTYDFTVVAGGSQTTSKDVVLIDFDEESFAKIGTYPIPRKTVAEVIAKAGQMRPRLIGLDMFLSETRNPEEDAAMQSALTSAAVVVLISQSSAGGLPPVVPLDMFCHPEHPGTTSGYCADGTPGAFGYAFENMPLDPDGFVRQANLFLGGAVPAESFPLTLAENYTQQSIKPADADHAKFLGHDVYYADPALKTFLIGAWSRQPVTLVPAWKILSGQVPANVLADKLVLIGQTNDAARDRHLTPVFRKADREGTRLRLGGSEVLGAAIRSLLEGLVVRPANPLERWAIVFLLCWDASYLLLALQPAFGVPIAVLLSVLPCGVSVLLYAKARFWLPFLPAQVGVAVVLPLTLGLQFVLEQLVSRKAHEQRKELMTLFSSYVDPAVAETIWERRSELSLNGEERVATVMFTDIRSFTALSAGQPPSVVLAWLNQYVTAMDEVIRQHGGFLNKFIGDGLMIIFGLPLSRGPAEDASRALEAALAMLERVKTLNAQNQGHPTTPQLRIGIGMHTGSLMAGSIGSASRQEYSAIGETVNLASRLESLNKPFKTEIMMSRATHDLLARRFTGFRALGQTKVAGFEEEIEIFTIDPPAIESPAREISERVQA